VENIKAIAELRKKKVEITDNSIEKLHSKLSVIL
jgi:hypothetical protein